MNKITKYTIGGLICIIVIVVAIMNFEPGGPRPPDYAVKKFLSHARDYDQLSADEKNRIFKRLANEAIQCESSSPLLEMQSTIEKRFAVKTKSQLAELFLYSTAKSVDLVPFVDALMAKGEIVIIPKGIKISVKEVYKRGGFLKIADKNGEEFFVSIKVVGMQPKTISEAINREIEKNPGDWSLKI